MKPLDPCDSEQVAARARLLAERCGCCNADVHVGVARAQIEIAVEVAVGEGISSEHPR